MRVEDAVYWALPHSLPDSVVTTAGSLAPAIACEFMTESAGMSDPIVSAPRMKRLFVIVRSKIVSPEWMSSEEGPRPTEEGDGGSRGLVLEGLGVVEAGVAVDHGAQVGVAHALLAGLRMAAAMESPAAVGDLSDLLHVQVEHVAGEAGDDFSGLAVVLPGRVEVSAGEIPSRSSERPMVRTQ